MIRIVPLKKEHFDEMTFQNDQAYSKIFITPEVKLELERGMSFAAVEDGKAFCCGGIIDYWPGRSSAWMILPEDLGHRFVPVHKAVKAFLEMQDYGRLEAVTASDFSNGHRWLKMLGFKLETERMKGYLPTGQDAAMYVRGDL